MMIESMAECCHGDCGPMQKEEVDGFHYNSMLVNVIHYLEFMVLVRQLRYSIVCVRTLHLSLTGALSNVLKQK